MVMLSSFAVARDRLSRPAKLMSNLAMAAAVKDKTAAEDLLRASDLEWTIGHSVRLTNGPSVGAAKALPDGTRLGLGDTVARADVAAWLLAAATDQFRAGRRRRHRRLKRHEQQRAGDRWHHLDRHLRGLDDADGRESSSDSGSVVLQRREPPAQQPWERPLRDVRLQHAHGASVGALRVQPDSERHDARLLAPVPDSSTTHGGRDSEDWRRRRNTAVAAPNPS